MPKATARPRRVAPAHRAALARRAVAQVAATSIWRRTGAPVKPATIASPRGAVHSGRRLRPILPWRREMLSLGALAMLTCVMTHASSPSADRAMFSLSLRPAHRVGTPTVVLKRLTVSATPAASHAPLPAHNRLIVAAMRATQPWTNACETACQHAMGRPSEVRTAGPAEREAMAAPGVSVASEGRAEAVARATQAPSSS